MTTFTLAKRVNERLMTAGLTLATAESCTGGLICAALTAVPGSSAILHGGFVTYSNAAKTRLLGVPAALIDEHGAVSEPVARAMAQGARESLGADLAIAVTGIAGPGGGTDAKPVGLVHFGLATPQGTQQHVMGYGDLGRDTVRTESVGTALERVLAYLDALPA